MENKITEKTIRNEQVQATIYRYRRWLEEVRLNSREKDEIDDIISELKSLIDYR